MTAADFDFEERTSPAVSVTNFVGEHGTLTLGTDTPGD